MDIKDWQGRPYPLNSVLKGVGPGWGHLVCRLIRDLEKMGWDGELHQIKEKFGGLRFYVGNGTDEIYERIHEAESESLSICEMCGEPGKPTGHNWIQTLCEKHTRKEDEDDD